MKNRLYKNFIKNFFQFLLAIFCLSLLQFLFQKPLLSSSEKKTSSHTLNLNKLKLIPMPRGDVESALINVNENRNPFENPAEIFESNLDALNLTIKFRGLVKSNNSVLAIIENNTVQKLYKAGDKINDQFLIKSISLDKSSIIISNGAKNYRLSLIKYID